MTDMVLSLENATFWLSKCAADLLLGNFFWCIFGVILGGNKFPVRSYAIQISSH